MKLKEITPNNGDTYHVGAGLVTFNEGWFVGDQPVTDELFTIIGELDAYLDGPIGLVKPKVFRWEGVTLMLVERKVLSENTIVKERFVKAPNGGVVKYFHNETQKDCIQATIEMLNAFARWKSKEEVIHELTKPI